MLVMRTRFCAIIRSPACSIMALTAPVRLRAVASGLMIEKVRSIAIVWVSFGNGRGCAPDDARAYSRHRAQHQGCPPRGKAAAAGGAPTVRFRTVSAMAERFRPAPA